MYVLVDKNDDSELSVEKKRNSFSCSCLYVELAAAQAVGNYYNYYDYHYDYYYYLASLHKNPPLLSDN